MNKTKILTITAALVAQIAIFQPSFADTLSVTGKVVITEGHVTPGCRSLVIRQNGTLNNFNFRIAATGQEDGVLAVTLTALATGNDVTVWYDSSVTSGCGSEPRVTWIDLHAPGF